MSVVSDTTKTKPSSHPQNVQRLGRVASRSSRILPHLIAPIFHCSEVKMLGYRVGRLVTSQGLRVPKFRFSTKAERRAKLESQKQSTSALLPLALIGAIGGVSYIVYDIKANPEGTLGVMYTGSPVESIVERISKSVRGQLDDVFLPASDKFLPDFGDPAVYGEVPPGTVAPPLLVVDLEKTLIGSIHDPQYGWRHVKRPGLDRFIKDLSQYYEIVIHSENDIGVSQDILMAIDPENRCHKLGAAHAEVRGDTILKRLDLMNRDIRRIVLIDDNPSSASLFPENALIVKPFTNINDTTDTVLYDLIPFLQAFVHEDVRNIPQTLEKLGTHDAEDAIVEYRMRVAKRKAEEEHRRNQGLGAVIRNVGKKEAVVDDGFIRSSILSPKDIVGVPLDTYDQVPGKKSLLPNEKNEPAKPVVKKKGGLFKSVDEWQQNNEENEMRKRELMMRIQMERQAGKHN